jgi:hypothetical protein
MRRIKIFKLLTDLVWIWLELFVKCLVNIFIWSMGEWDKVPISSMENINKVILSAEHSRCIHYHSRSVFRTYLLFCCLMTSFYAYGSLITKRSWRLIVQGHFFRLYFIKLYWKLQIGKRSSAALRYGLSSSFPFFSYLSCRN